MKHYYTVIFRRFRAKQPPTTGSIIRIVRVVAINERKALDRAVTKIGGRRAQWQPAPEVGDPYGCFAGRGLYGRLTWEVIRG